MDLHEELSVLHSTGQGRMTEGDKIPVFSERSILWLHVGSGWKMKVSVTSSSLVMNAVGVFVRISSLPICRMQAWPDTDMTMSSGRTCDHAGA